MAEIVVRGTGKLEEVIQRSLFWLKDVKQILDIQRKLEEPTNCMSLDQVTRVLTTVHSTLDQSGISPYGSLH